MEKENQNMFPNEWICPITQELMKDPVIADDGFSYERKAIEDWFQKSHLSPVTGLDLTTTKLIPNRALKNTIQQHHEKSQGAKEVEKSETEKTNETSISVKSEVKGARSGDFLEMQAHAIIDDETKDYILNIDIIPPETRQSANRKPLSLVCILDTSESMNIDALKDAKDTESHGFSRLDLVKHSINTLIEFMENYDELTIITFNTSAQCLMQTTKMNQAGKKLALKWIRDLEGQGTTNIWEGLRIALDSLKKINHKNKNVYTLLLTDGEPNLNPPRGIVPTLAKYIQIEELDTPNIHVFGYGYELDTKLLEEIAVKGAGTFAYIPDCSMVGTVFVNFMANCLSTVTNRLQLDLETPKRAKCEVIGFKSTSPKGFNYNLGSVQYGQRRTFSVRLPSNSITFDEEDAFKFSIKYGGSYGEQNYLQVPVSGMNKIVKEDVDSMVRCKYLSLLRNCINYGTKFQMALNDILAFYFRLQKLDSTEFIEAVMKEVKYDDDENLGQVEKAFLKEEWYKKWGKKYIPSLLLAHLMQVCTNFKDPALQLYGGELFTDYQNKMDMVFIKMAPPKPSAKKEEKKVYKPAPPTMKSYYNNYGGCVDGECTVKVWRQQSETGQCIQVVEKLKNVKKGDRIGDKKVEVVCMVETRVFAFVDMVRIGRLTITPWHPIKHQNSWQFPVSIQESQKVFVESYFNFVVKGEVGIQIEGIECIGLGHSINDNPVTQHDYLSSPQVIHDLMSEPSQFQRGHVTIRQTQRNPTNGRIQKFIVA